jgi:Electron transfer DM13
MFMKKKIFHILVAIIGVAVLAFAYYAISPFFINIKLDEALPETKQMESKAMEKSQSQAILAPIVGTTGHPASGTARVIEIDGKSYVRYENFKTINGPDLYIYLAKDLDAKEYMNLGRLRATEGNVNYEIPTDVNLQDYKYVMVWCKAFGVLFNYADISKSVQKML